MIQTVKGTRDILPEDMPLWRRVEEVSREAFRRYGFRGQVSFDAEGCAWITSVVSNRVIRVAPWELPRS